MVCVILAAKLVSSPSLVLESHFEPLPNLLYQLDMVSGFLSHTRSEGISQIWKQRIATSPGDAKELTRWKTTMDRLQSQGQGRWDPSMIYSAMTLQSDAERVRLIGLTSTSTVEFTKRVAKEVDAKAARELSEVLAEFQPEFLKWWNEEAAPKGAKFAEKASQLLKSDKLSQAARNLVNFYQPDLPNGFVIPFQFMYKPKFKEGSSGEQVGHAAVMEFFEGDSPANRMDISMHELSHFLFRKVRIAKHKQLLSNFRKVKDPAALAVYSIMNEGLATALCNGMVAESLMQPEPFRQYREAPLSWYTNAPIDGTAKASYDWLKQFTANGGTLHDPKFAEGYVKAVHNGLGEFALSPGMRLFGANYVWNSSWPQELSSLPGNYIQSTVSSGFRDTDVVKVYQEVKRTSQLLSTILILKSNEIEPIAKVEPLVGKSLPAIRQQLKSTRSALFGATQPSGVGLYVIVSDDLKAVERELKRLGELRVELRGVLP